MLILKDYQSLLGINRLTILEWIFFKSRSSSVFPKWVIVSIIEVLQRTNTTFLGIKQIKLYFHLHSIQDRLQKPNIYFSYLFYNDYFISTFEMTEQHSNPYTLKEEESLSRLYLRCWLFGKEGIAKLLKWWE